MLHKNLIRRLDLTAAGETLLHHARRMLFDLEKMGLELDEHLQGMRGQVAKAGRNRDLHPAPVGLS